MLKGQKKTDYQRNYMRKRRLLDPAVRPKTFNAGETISFKGIPFYKVPEGKTITVDVDADGNPIPDFT